MHLTIPMLASSSPCSPARRAGGRVRLKVMEWASSRWSARQAVGTLLLIAASAWAQPANPNLPAELEPYFNAIRTVESNSHPWSIFDNTAQRSYRLTSRDEAETTAKKLLSYGHNLDLGLMQLNWKYQGRRPGVNIDNIFEPQTNIGIAKQVFLEFWEQARKVSTDFNARIQAAVGAYNNGRVHLPNHSYVAKVWNALGKAASEVPVQIAAASTGSKSVLDGALASYQDKKQWVSDQLDAMKAKSEDAKAKAKGEHLREGGRKDGGLLSDAMGVLGGVFGATIAGLIIYFGIPLIGSMGALKAARMMMTAKNLLSKNDD